jgi:hypothetical protein
MHPLPTGPVSTHRHDIITGISPTAELPLRKSRIGDRPAPNVKPLRKFGPLVEIARLAG